MASIDLYLDRIDAHLGADPEVANDIRRELRAHLEDLVERYCAEGVALPEAAERALARFGEAEQVRSGLHDVLHGGPEWLRRVEGMAGGGLLGAAIALLLPVGGHLEFVTLPFATPAGWDTGRVLMAVNGLLTGGLIGLLSGRRGLVVGWVTGSLVWMAEYAVHFASGATDITPRDGGLHHLTTMLLSPLLGGLFGAAVGGGCSALLAATSKLRPGAR